MRLWSNVFTLAVIALCAFAVAVGMGKSAYTAQGPLTQERVMEVPRGASLNAIARTFEEEGVITSAFVFSTAARVMGVAADLKAGEYRIEPGASMERVLGKVTDGAAVQHRVTVPPGITSAQVVALLNEMAILEGEITEVPLEGSLAPETYFVQRGEERQAVIDRMLRAQQRTLAELWRDRQEELPIATPEEALVLASIVEKETGVAYERAQVASVFVNRLNIGMRLQSDPTTIYGITLGSGPLGRELTRTDLREETPYNTYRINGLPPTPIANPGRAAIEAVLNPAETEYFYFVASGDGGHAFARTLDEHNANVRAWRALRDQQRSQSN